MAEKQVSNGGYRDLGTIPPLSNLVRAYPGGRWAQGEKALNVVFATKKDDR